MKKLLLILLCLPMLGFGQKLISLRSTNLIAQDTSVIYKADTVYFFGYDFSHTLVSTKHPIKDYIFPWIIHISKEAPSSFFEKKMHMNVIHDFAHTNKVNVEFLEKINSAIRVKTDESIASYPLLFDNANVASKNDKKIKEENIGRRIPNQLIQEFLSEYSLNQTRGLGLVVFIAEINKQNESTLLQFVFFEINSRDIISVDNYYLPGATGVGMGNHWKFNFSFSVIKFLNHYNLDLYFDYRSEYKRKKKRMKKLK